MQNRAETLRQIALGDKKPSWLGCIADEVEMLKAERDRLKRDLTTCQGVGSRYEYEISQLNAEIKRKEAAIAGQAKQLKDAVAEPERVMRERDAAVRDICDIAGDSFPCDQCAKDNRSCGEDVVFCKGFKWRGPCAENGGTEE